MHPAEPEEVEPEMPGEDYDEAPGWDAIDAECSRVYPDQPDPMHLAPPIKAAQRH